MKVIKTCNEIALDIKCIHRDDTTWHHLLVKLTKQFPSEMECERDVSESKISDIYKKYQMGDSVEFGWE